MDKVETQIEAISVVKCKTVAKVIFVVMIALLFSSAIINCFAEHEADENVVITGLYNKIDKPKLLEVSIFYNSAIEFSGFQSALWNFSESLTNSLQFGFGNEAEEFYKSWQVGFFNMVARANGYTRRGVQAGVININYGLQHCCRSDKDELGNTWTDLVQVGIINTAGIYPQYSGRRHNEEVQGERCTIQIGLINKMNIDARPENGQEPKSTAMIFYQKKCFDLYN